MAIQWQPNIVRRQDSNARLDYLLDITEWLNGQTVDTVTVTADNGAIIEIIPSPEGEVYFWVSGLSCKNTVTVRVSTLLGVEQDFSFLFIPFES